MKQTIFNNRKKLAKAYARLGYFWFFLVFGTTIIILLDDVIPLGLKIVVSIMLFGIAILLLTEAINVRKKGVKGIPEQYPDGIAMPKWKPHD